MILLQFDGANKKWVTVNHHPSSRTCACVYLITFMLICLHYGAIPFVLDIATLPIFLVIFLFGVRAQLRGTLIVLGGDHLMRLNMDEYLWSRLLMTETEIQKTYLWSGPHLTKIYNIWLQRTDTLVSTRRSPRRITYLWLQCSDIGRSRLVILLREFPATSGIQTRH